MIPQDLDLNAQIKQEQVRGFHKLPDLFHELLRSKTIDHPVVKCEAVWHDRPDYNLPISYHRPV